MALIRRSIVRFSLLVVVCVSALTLAACQEEPPEKELIGIWSNETNYIVYREDGTFSVAYSISRLESSPVDWGTFTFDGETLTFFVAEEGECKGVNGTFKIEFSEEGEAIFTTVEDSCFGREDNMTKRPWSRYTP